MLPLYKSDEYYKKFIGKLYGRNLEMDGFDLQYTIKVVEPTEDEKRNNGSEYLWRY